MPDTKDKYTRVNKTMIKTKCYKYIYRDDCVTENRIVIYKRQMLRIGKILAVDLYI